MGFVSRLVDDPIDAITDNHFTSSPEGIMDGVRLVASGGTDVGAWGNVLGDATGNNWMGPIANMGQSLSGSFGGGSSGGGLSTIFGGGSSSGGGFGGFGNYGGGDTGAFDMGGSFGGSPGAGGWSDIFSGFGNNTPSYDSGFGDWFGNIGDSLGSLWGSAKTGIGDLNKQVSGTTGMNLTQLGRGVYDAYAKNQMSKSAGQRADTLANLFNNDSPYAQVMQQQLSAKDAATGRNSQYGPRSVELQAALASKQADVLNSPQYNALRNAQTSNKLGMFNSLIANTAANYISKKTPPAVTSALNNVAQYIGF